MQGNCHQLMWSIKHALAMKLMLQSGHLRIIPSRPSELQIMLHSAFSSNLSCSSPSNFD